MEEEKKLLKSGCSPDVGKATQFGQPNGNKPMRPQDALTIRHFYSWALNKATEAELIEYRFNKKNPFARREFVRAILESNGKVVDILATITNQAHGLPKQSIEVDDVKRTMIIETK